MDWLDRITSIFNFTHEKSTYNLVIFSKLTPQATKPRGKKWIKLKFSFHLFLSTSSFSEFASIRSCSNKSLSVEGRSDFANDTINVNPYWIQNFEWSYLNFKCKGTFLK